MPLPHTALFGTQVSVIRADARSPTGFLTPADSARRPFDPGACGTRISKGVVQWSAWLFGVPVKSTVSPDFTVGPSVSSAAANGAALAFSTLSLGRVGLGRRALMTSTGVGWRRGSRGSVTFRHALAWNVHTPSLIPSASHVSPSMHVIDEGGKPAIG